MLWRRGKSYSQDLRERVFAAADEGEPVVRIATMLRVSVSYVSKVLPRRRLTGQTQARPQRCHVVPKLSGLSDAPALRQRPHPGDACGSGAAAAEDPALREGRLRAPPPSLPPGGGRRDSSAGPRVRPGRDSLGGEAVSSRASQR